MMMSSYDINTCYQKAHFLAQTLHETGGYELMGESGNSSYLQGKRYWPYYGRGLIQLSWQKNYFDFGGNGFVIDGLNLGFYDKAKNTDIKRKELINSTDTSNPDKVMISRKSSINTAGFFLTRKAYGGSKNLNTITRNNPRDIEKVSICINGKNKKTGRANGIEDKIRIYEIIKTAWGLE